MSIELVKAEFDDLNTILQMQKEAFAELYKKYQEKRLGIEAIQMPSTSPANAAWTLERLKEEWSSALLPCLKERGK